MITFNEGDRVTIDTNVWMVSGTRRREGAARTGVNLVDPLNRQRGTSLFADVLEWMINRGKAVHEPVARHGDTSMDRVGAFLRQHEARMAAGSNTSDVIAHYDPTKLTVDDLRATLAAREDAERRLAAVGKLLPGMLRDATWDAHVADLERIRALVVGR
jgi:hypothetical protein